MYLIIYYETTWSKKKKKNLLIEEVKNLFYNKIPAVWYDRTENGAFMCRYKAVFSLKETEQR